MARKIHTNNNKIKELATKIGEIYKTAANDPNHVIDKKKLVEAIGLAMLSKDKSESNPNTKDRKTLMFDVVIDEDLDDNTRLVWVTLPTPDLKFNGVSGYEAWVDYMETSLNYNKNTQKFNNDVELIKLTEAMLFGCGR